MTRLDVHNIRRTFGANPVLACISFKVEDGDKIGIIGANGSGKSTLLKLITGEEPPDEGVISKPRGTKVGYISQYLAITAAHTVLDEVWSALSDLTDLERRLRATEQSLSSPALAEHRTEMERTLNRYNLLQAQFEVQEGYEAQARVDAIVDGLGLTPKRDQRIDTLSGGEKNIVALARTLVGEPDILLLDKPANHLDFEGLDWLERFLQAYSGTLIIVSHNRYLLDRTVTRILEWERPTT